MMKWAAAGFFFLALVGCQRPSPTLGKSDSEPCEKVIARISSRLTRPHKVFPCKDSSPQLLLGEKDFSKRRVGSIMILGISSLMISEFDLSIKSGRDGMARMLEEGEYGQKPHRLNSSILAVFQDSPYFFGGFTKTNEGQKSLKDYAINETDAKWLESASEAEVQKLRNNLKDELMKAAGL